ncbi:MAG TPA: CAP domain-containing protein [Candidatus Sulfotelmatobacter sp.]|nr:CAP domain-containing protein [Candidatus Sulfotelmatobacter sp.]
MSLTAQRKPKSYQLKKHAGHHRHSRVYLKTYWPYIPIVLILTAGIGLNSLYQSSRSSTSLSSFSSASLLSVTNAKRSSSGVSPLSISSELSSAAQVKANDLVNENYLSHTSPVGVTPWNLVQATGYNYQRAGENLASGFTSSATVVQAWMASGAHKANLLSPSYSNVGFGVAKSSNYLGKGPAVVVVAEYAQPKVTPVSVPTNNFYAPPLASVSRLQLANSTLIELSVLFITILSGAAVFMLLAHRFKNLPKYARSGELFVLHHASLDIIVVALLTFGLVMTRSAGIIS